ncbi:MAG: cadherin repeat domain-containing protein, partial [Gammaproteobacteria bacterium]
MRLVICSISTFVLTICLTAISGAEAAYDSAKKDGTSTIMLGGFASSRPLVQDWRQYAARDEVKPKLQTPGRIVLESVKVPLIDVPSPILLLTLQANNIQVREVWQVTNAANAFTVKNDGELYLTAVNNKAAIFVATVYLIDNFQALNAAYHNLTASAVITVEVMSGDLLAAQPPRLEVAAGVAEEVYVFEASGGTMPHTYTLRGNPAANAFAFSNGTLSVNVNATIGEYRFTVEVADAAGMSVTVTATVSVAAAATIRVGGGMAVLSFQGQEKDIADGATRLFNPKSTYGVMVSAEDAATVAIEAPQNAWQITLYGGGEAYFSGVPDGGEIVVAVSLVGDSDSNAPVSLYYVFDGVVVPVVSQGRIFSRSYGGQWYLVIAEGAADVLGQGSPANVNFLALGDGRWNLNGVLEEKPFTLDDFMATVPYRYTGEVGEMRANDGVAPSFSLVGDSAVFTVTMWSGLKSGQWLPGLLAIIEPQEGPLTLSVTVAAEDHLGDMLGDYGYANRMATVTVKVEVEAPPLTLSESTLSLSPLMVTASGGYRPYTYNIITGNEGNYFDLDAHSGGLRFRELDKGTYSLTVQVSDDRSNTDDGLVVVKVTV